MIMSLSAAGYWAVDAKEETAMNGTWKKGPGTELFAALERVGSHLLAYLWSLNCLRLGSNAYHSNALLMACATCHSQREQTALVEGFVHVAATLPSYAQRYPCSV